MADRLSIDGLFLAAATLAQAQIMHEKNIGEPSIRERAGGSRPLDTIGIFKTCLGIVEGCATERGWAPDGGWQDLKDSVLD